MSKKVVAGIDIGGTNTKFGLVNEAGKILSRDVIHTASFEKAKEFVQAVGSRLKTMAASLPGAEVEGIGIGSPNGNFFSGNVEFAPNLNWKGIVPLSKLFREATGIPAVLTNDAKAAAIGEMVFGGAKNLKDFFFITLGTGLGSGIISGGQVVYGHDGFAGEMGHVIIKPESNRLCGCGRYGCLETYASATGVTRSYFKFLGALDQHPDMDPDQIDSAHIYQLAKAGDKVALRTFEYTGEILGLALANATNLFSPETIFLFGGLTQAGDLIFNPTRKSYEKNLLPIYKGKAKIIASSLPHNDAGILGAASLMLNELKKKS